jgi:hypothetical protein
MPTGAWLAERIMAEMEDLDRSAARAQLAWKRAERRGADDALFLDAAAMSLHGFYTGLERIFELICRHVDQAEPDGQDWHRNLLRRMAEDEVGRRPAVISRDVAESLDEYRRFRHVVRNVYAANLVPTRMAPLIVMLPQTWREVRADLVAFAEFLRATEAS